MRPCTTMRSSCGVFLLMVAASPVIAEVELRGSPAELAKYIRPERQVLTLVGRAREVVQADVGTVVVAVKTQGKDLAGSLAANAERRWQIAQALQREGIDARNIRSERFSTSPQLGWFGKQPSSFEVVNRIEVKISDDRQRSVVADDVDSNPFEDQVIEVWATVTFEATARTEAAAK